MEREFSSFFCPILYRDEATDLCLGHVINEAFTSSDRTRVLQRADVDNFFGAKFESDFVLLDHYGKVTAADALINRGLPSKLRPRILLQKQEVEFYRPKGPVPPQHTVMQVNQPGHRPVNLAIKLSPTDIHSSIDGKWELTLEGDIRLAVLVSVLKAAHLTLFARMGYRYALSAGGHFLGHTILGSFVADNLGRSKADVLTAAMNHFKPFSNLVRPMLKWPPEIKGTLSDGIVHVCPARGGFWAIMVFVRAGPTMHAVLVPVLEQVEPAVRFTEFLVQPAPRFDATFATLEEDRWAISPRIHTMDWPEGRFDTPLGET
jgi:hypothetical protein